MEDDTSISTKRAISQLNFSDDPNNMKIRPVSENYSNG